jgi:hypothetical protein
VGLLPDSLSKKHTKDEYVRRIKALYLDELFNHVDGGSITITSKAIKIFVMFPTTLRHGVALASVAIFHEH